MSDRREVFQVQRKTAGGWQSESGGRFTKDANTRDPKQDAISYAQTAFKVWSGKQQVRVQRIETETVYDSGEPA